MSKLSIKTRGKYAFAVCRNGRQLPRFRHETEDEARADATRQSIKRPGTTFIVLQEIARISTISDPAANAPGDRESRAASSPLNSRPARQGGACDDD